MKCLNVEIKAVCRQPQKVRLALKAMKAVFKGVDSQTDTYFKVKKGRLKLREGNIENALIHYFRQDKRGPKNSKVNIFKTERNSCLGPLLSSALGVKAVVKKRREIYFLGNVKFHIDRVEKLGSFVEIEAIDSSGRIGRSALLGQCLRFIKLFGISENDLIEGSYSDML